MSRIKDLLSPYRGLPREIYVIFASRIVNAMGCFVMPLMTIIMTDRIGLPKETAGFYLSLNSLIYPMASMLGGMLADIIGRKFLIITFDTLAALLYMSCGFIEPSMTLIYVILAASACFSVAGPAHDSLIADLTTPENRAGAYALSYLGWNVGFAIGPMLGGFLYRKYLPMVFIGDALTALLSLSLIFFFVKETFEKTKEEITDDSRKLERREEGSIITVLLKRPILLYFAIIAFGYHFAYSQWTFLMPIHSMQNFGDLGAQYFGWMASLNGFVVILFTPILTKITEKMKGMRKMVYGILLYAAGFGMLGVLNTLAYFFLSVFIFTLGEILLSISVMPFIANHTPASHRGRMNAVLPTIMGTGYAIGPMTMGKILNHTTVESAWLILGGMTAVSAFFMFCLEKYDGWTSARAAEVDEAVEI
ncbi:MAG TPA: MFS transporter [Candidatus Nitrosocosmicus sp.]|nr:MFS transporter [Candidatus Nitrosocosmicus sp.]